jgi:hypothetical protein
MMAAIVAALSISACGEALQATGGTGGEGGFGQDLRGVWRDWPVLTPESCRSRLATRLGAIPR